MSSRWNRTFSKERSSDAEVRVPDLESLRSGLAECGGFLKLSRVDESPAAAALFLKRFKLKIPDFPVHYTATYVQPDSSRVVGYVHMTERPEYRLCGGLCVDEMAYRKMTAADFAAIKKHGGIAKLLMVASCLDNGTSSATFACTGDKRSRRIIEQMGFRRIVEPYTYALWHSRALSDARMADLTRMVIQEGMF